MWGMTSGGWAPLSSPQRQSQGHLTPFRAFCVSPGKIPQATSKCPGQWAGQPSPPPGLTSPMYIDTPSSSSRAELLRWSRWSLLLLDAGCQVQPLILPTDCFVFLRLEGLSSWRLASNSWQSSCLHFPVVLMTGVHRQVCTAIPDSPPPPL